MPSTALTILRRRRRWRGCPFFGIAKLLSGLVAGDLMAFFGSDCLLANGRQQWSDSHTAPVTFAL